MEAILEMVQKILAYFNETDAVNVIEIIKNSLASIFAGIPMPL